MSKYDNIIKFLGKEDQHPPEEILKTMESEQGPENLDELSGLPAQNMENVENLIKGAAGEPQPKTAEIDAELLKELESLDEAPPAVEELQKSMLTQNIEPGAEEPLSAAPEIQAQAEIPGEEPSSLLEPQFMEMPSFEEPAPSGAEETPSGPEPDLSDMLAGLSPEGAGPETAKEEIPSLGEMPAAPEIKEEELPVFEMPEVQSPETPGPSGEAAASQEFEFPEFKAEEPSGIPSGAPVEPAEFVPEEKPAEAALPEFTPMPSEEHPPEQPGTRQELGHDEALKIRDKINKISDPNLRKKVRQIILESKIPQDKLTQLISMLLNDENESRIRAIADSYMPDSSVRKREAPRERRPVAGRRVIYTEEAKRAREFRRELTGATRYFFAFIIFIIALVISIWQLVWIPFTANLHYNKGISYFKVQDYNAVEQEFEAGKRLEDTRIGGPDLNWNSIYASNYIAQRQFDRARKKYEDALQYNPYDINTVYNYADFDKNVIYPPKFEDSLKLYGRLTNRWPDNFQYMDKIGLTEIQWGDRTGDTNHYLDANNLYENYVSKPGHIRHVDSYYRLLDVALRVTNTERIDTLYDTIDHYNKNAVNVHTLTDLARYYIDNRRLDRAKLVFEKMMPVNPNYDEAYYEHGRYLALNMDYYRAMSEVSNAILRNPKNGKAYNLLGEIYNVYAGAGETNSVVQAIKQFENAIQYSPDYYKPYANLGHIYFYNMLNFENPDEALNKSFQYYKAAQLLLPQDKKDDLLYYNLGWLYYKFNDYADSFNSFARLYINDPHNPILSYNLGNIYFHENNFSFAKIEYDKAIEYYRAIADKIGYINPDLDRHKEIYGQLARCYNNRGVTFAVMAKKYGKAGSEFEQNALLDFYRAKDYANKINVIYNFAEYNIKYVVNRSIKKTGPAIDNELVKRTSLQRYTEEYRVKMISNI